jgi:ribonuclease HI
MDAMTITAAADGSALGNPGPAGWAWYIDEARWAAGGWECGTNNRGELQAVLELLEATARAGLADEPLRVLCDSQYVINSVTKWMPGWKRRGWKKSDGRPVLNRDQLEAIDRALAGRDVRFDWVKGHAGHEMNEAADQRAHGAALAIKAWRSAPAGPRLAPGGPKTSGAGGAETAAARPTGPRFVSVADAQTTGGAPRTPTRGARPSVRLVLDPASPVAVATARWLADVARLRDLDVHWTVTGTAPLPDDLRTLLGASARPAADAAPDRHDAPAGAATPALLVIGGSVFRGPVVDPAPTGRAAVRLWDALALLAGVPGFRAIERDDATARP